MKASNQSSNKHSKKQDKILKKYQCSEFAPKMESLEGHKISLQGMTLK